MIKKSILFMLVLLLFSYGLFAFEAGVTIGTISKPSRLNYGLSVGMGLLIPMVKLEIEVYRKADTEVPELKNTVTGGIKFRPKMGKFAPYAIVGVGAESASFGFEFDEYESFTFIGGGVHYYLAGMISLRADIRFLNYSGCNRTRLSTGLFFHF
jgi:hypothetical protein